MRLFICALSAFLAFGPLAAANDDRPIDGPAAAVPKAVVLGAGFGLTADDFGYIVVDVADGAVVTELNADRTFIPASVAKVPTTTAALEILGGDHRFNTTIFIDGTVADGVLDGTLTLRGGGDPVLTGDDLQFLAQAVARSGITKVAGGFHYDTTHLVEIPQINAHQPEAAGYNPGVGALSVNFNRVRLKWSNDSDGPSGQAHAVSDKVNLPLDAIGFAPAEDALPGALARAGPFPEDNWLLSPKISPRGEDWLPIANPGLIAAQMFHLLAAEEGVILPEPSPGKVGPTAREIARQESTELTAIVREVLRYSNNMAAELVGLAASRAVTGEALPLEDSAKTLSDYWHSRIPDVDWDGFYLENQSGLSSRSRVTPRQLVAILEHAAQPTGESALFYSLLRPASWQAPNGKTVRIRAKTGTIAYGRGLAGYIDAIDGSRLAFAVFFNDLKSRAALDAAFDPRIDIPDPASRRWRGRVLKLEQTLLNGWAAGS